VGLIVDRAVRKSTAASIDSPMDHRLRRAFMETARSFNVIDMSAGGLSLPQPNPERGRRLGQGPSPGIRRCLGSSTSSCRGQADNRSFHSQLARCGDS
jgi:hypothetical protein